MAQSHATNTRADHARDGGPSVRVGLIGNGIQLSRTPAMHQAEGAALGLDYRYDLLDPEAPDGPTGSLEEILSQAEAQGFAGLNITFPFKREVVGLLDELSDAAEKIGAVNTVVFADGKRRGHNTDFWGFSESLRLGLPEVEKTCVLLIGAGGAGGAVAHGLKSLGVSRLLVADASPAAAEALAREVAGEVVTDMEAAAAEANGIVNATPMGMAKLPGTSIDPELIEPRHWVADIVYFPLETELLRAARAKGCRTLDGGGMAVFQAVRAFKLFTGLTPDRARMRATFDSFD